MSESHEKTSPEMQAIQLFAIKTAIVAAAVVVSAWMVLGLIGTQIDQIRDDLRAATRVNGRVFWARVEKNIVQAADEDNDLSPERKARLLAAVRTLSDRWRPFLVELTAEPSRQPVPPVQK